MVNWWFGLVVWIFGITISWFYCFLEKSVVSNYACWDREIFWKIWEDMTWTYPIVRVVPKVKANSSKRPESDNLQRMSGKPNSHDLEDHPIWKGNNPRNRGLTITRIINHSLTGMILQVWCQCWLVVGSWNFTPGACSILLKMVFFLVSNSSRLSNWKSLKACISISCLSEFFNLIIDINEIHDRYPKSSTNWNL